MSNVFVKGASLSSFSAAFKHIHAESRKLTTTPLPKPLRRLPWSKAPDSYYLTLSHSVSAYIDALFPIEASAVKKLIGMASVKSQVDALLVQIVDNVVGIAARYYSVCTDFKKTILLNNVLKKRSALEKHFLNNPAYLSCFGGTTIAHHDDLVTYFLRYVTKHCIRLLAPIEDSLNRLTSRSDAELDKTQDTLITGLAKNFKKVKKISRNILVTYEATAVDAAKSLNRDIHLASGDPNRTKILRERRAHLMEFVSLVQSAYQSLDANDALSFATGVFEVEESLNENHRKAEFTSVIRARRGLKNKKENDPYYSLYALAKEDAKKGGFWSRVFNKIHGNKHKEGKHGGRGFDNLWDRRAVREAFFAAGPAGVLAYHALPVAYKAGRMTVGALKFIAPKLWWLTKNVGAFGSNAAVNILFNHANNLFRGKLKGSLADDLRRKLLVDNVGGRIGNFMSTPIMDFEAYQRAGDLASRVGDRLGRHAGHLGRGLRKLKSKLPGVVQSTKSSLKSAASRAKHSLRRSFVSASVTGGLLFGGPSGYRSLLGRKLLGGASRIRSSVSTGISSLSDLINKVPNSIGLDRSRGPAFDFGRNSGGHPPPLPSGNGSNPGASPTPIPHSSHITPVGSGSIPRPLSSHRFVPGAGAYNMQHARRYAPRHIPITGPGFSPVPGVSEDTLTSQAHNAEESLNIQKSIQKLLEQLVERVRKGGKGASSALDILGNIIKNLPSILPKILPMLGSILPKALAGGGILAAGAWAAKKALGAGRSLVSGIANLAGSSIEKVKSFRGAPTVSGSSAPGGAKLTGMLGRVLGGLGKLFGVVGAFAAGYEIGTALYENFDVEILDGIDSVVKMYNDTVEYLSNKVNNVVNGVKNYIGDKKEQGRKALVGVLGPTISKMLGIDTPSSTAGGKLPTAAATSIAYGGTAPDPHPKRTASGKVTTEVVPEPLPSANTTVPTPETTKSQKDNGSSGIGSVTGSASPGIPTMSYFDEGFLLLNLGALTG